MYCRDCIETWCVAHLQIDLPLLDIQALDPQLPNSNRQRKNLGLGGVGTRQYTDFT